MIGKTLSHYKVIEQLGRGDVGKVLLNDDTTLDRKVALKFLTELSPVIPRERQGLNERPSCRPL
jgi:serine/threonine protein kinase